MLNAQDMIKTNTIPRPESFHEMSDSFRVLLGQTKGQGIVKNCCAWKGHSYSKGVTMPRLQCLQLNLLKVSGCTASKWWYQWNKLHFKKIGPKIKLSTIHVEAISSAVLLCRSDHSWNQVVLCHLFLSSTEEDFPPKQACLVGITTWERPDKSEDFLYLSVSTHFIESTLNLGSLYSATLNRSVPCTAWIKHQVLDKPSTVWAWTA